MELRIGTSRDSGLCRHMDAVWRQTSGFQSNNSEPRTGMYMYLDYYSLSEDPFQAHEEKTSLWLGGNLPGVFSSLEQAITKGKGMIMLSGGGGTGKSTLVKMISDILRDRFIIVTLLNSELNVLDFYNFLSVKLGLNQEFKSKSAFLVHLRNAFRSSQPTRWKSFADNQPG